MDEGRDADVILTSSIPSLVSAAAMTVYPFILVDPRLTGDYLERALAHEKVHLAQQRRWCIYGLGLGLVLWFLLYLAVLPVYWNPWRRKWETEAYRSEGLTPSEIDGILAQKPYWLKKENA